MAPWSLWWARLPARSPANELALYERRGVMGIAPTLLDLPALLRPDCMYDRGLSAVQYATYVVILSSADLADFIATLPWICQGERCALRTINLVAWTWPLAAFAEDAPMLGFGAPFVGPRQVGCTRSSFSPLFRFPFES